MRWMLTEELADGLCQKDPAGLEAGYVSVNHSDRVRNEVLVGIPSL